jgi:hypothetical protein
MHMYRLDPRIVFKTSYNLRLKLAENCLKLDSASSRCSFCGVTSMSPWKELRLRGLLRTFDDPI